MSFFAPLALALPLAFSPYGAASLHASQSQALEPATDAAANGWDEPTDDTATDDTTTDDTTTDDTATEDTATEDTATTEIPVLGPAQPVPPPTLPPAAGTGIVKKPAPQPQDKKGIGLIAAAGAVGGLAIFAGVGRMVIISDACASGSEIVTDAEASITNCVTSAKNLLSLTVLEWLANSTAYGLAPAAGLVRGHYDASSYVYSGSPDRKGLLLAGIGGGLLGAGVIAKVGLWASVLSGKRFICPVDTNYGKCVRRNFVGYFGGVQLASSAITAGAGLLAYGVVYNRDRVAKERLFFRPEQVKLSPSLTRNFAGLSLTGRF